MPFQSILYEHGRADTGDAPAEAPEYFRDLNLDQIVEGIAAGKQEYELKPFFYDSLKTIEAIEYRADVMRDLEDERVLACVNRFAASMRLMREQLEQSNKLYYKYQKERWFLHAVETYCAAVRAINGDLLELKVASRGLLAFRDFVANYAGSDPFAFLLATSSTIAGDLAKVNYSILIKGNGFTVRKYDSEDDYSAQVAHTFEKFRQGAVDDYRVRLSSSVEMNHVEAKVLEFVSLLHKQPFAELDEFFVRHQGFADPTLMRFDREIEFYIAYLEYMSRFKRAGLRFTYARVSATNKAVHAQEVFDLALATTLTGTETEIVCNDIDLHGKERVLIVSGPNQGGKTTLARTFGQLHHLASIGCPVPGRDAHLFLFDSIFTHFEKEEKIENLRGKLQDDLMRIRAILRKATPQSILIVNECFNSTTLSDAVFLARKIIDRVAELDLLCVCVTFLDELATSSEKTVSMVSTVVPDNPVLRTYKVVRKPADGRSYAISIAEKYGLTYERVKARIPL
jgi:hypothetical protein